MVPTVEQLVQTHTEFLGRMSDEMQHQDNAFTDSLNVSALLQIAGRSLGSQCIRFDKIFQGGFNQVFNLWFEDSSILALIRINMPLGGGSFFSLEQRNDRVRSEAATLKWIHENTSVPVPRVYAYDGNPENPVGAAYIIEERILGQPLCEVWRDMCVAQRCDLTKQLAHIQAELLKTSFPMIGGLYEDCEKSGPSRFYIGKNTPPVTLERRWIDRGPWKTSREQLKSYMAEELKELQCDKAAVLSQRKICGVEHLPYDATEFEELYIAISELVDRVELFDKWEPFYGIMHPDLSNTHNILVSYDNPSIIVGLIDWEGTRVQPWWHSPITPDIVSDENDAPDKDAFGNLWRDACEEWATIIESRGPRDLLQPIGPHLRMIEFLVTDNSAANTTVEAVVEEVIGWRLKWPQLHDPAFTKLDQFLRKHSPGFHIAPAQDPPLFASA